MSADIPENVRYVYDIDDWIPITHQRIQSSGKIHPPEPKRAEHGIRSGVVVDVIVDPSGECIHLGETRVDTRDRINVGSHLFDTHSIEPGDYVDILIRVVTADGTD